MPANPRPAPSSWGELFPDGVLPSQYAANVSLGNVLAAQAENARLTGIYLGGFKNWLTNVQNGAYSPDPASPNYVAAPLPPFMAVPNPIDGSGNQDMGWAYSTTDRILPLPDTTGLEDKSVTQAQHYAKLPAGIFDLGKEQPTNPGWFNLGPNDTMPPNQVVTLADGTKYQKFSGFAPHTGWYQKLN